jgi:transposase
VLAVLSQRDLVPAVWLPDPSIRRERELARFRLHLVRHRTTLKKPHPRHADHVRAPMPGV